MDRTHSRFISGASLKRNWIAFGLSWAALDLWAHRIKASLRLCQNPSMFPSQIQTSQPANQPTTQNTQCVSQRSARTETRVNKLLRDSPIDRLTSMRCHTKPQHLCGRGRWSGKWGGQPQNPITAFIHLCSWITVCGLPRISLINNKSKHLTAEKQRIRLNWMCLMKRYHNCFNFFIYQSQQISANLS